jgi:hypothetical protein
MSLTWINKNEVLYHLDNGNTIHYKIVGGTAYHFDTPEAVVNIIEDALRNRFEIRLRFGYGDTKDGRDWGEQCDTTGYIGRSSGTIKVPLLLSKITSHDGGSLLDHCIVRIESKRRKDHDFTEVYRHPKYHKE